MKKILLLYILLLTVSLASCGTAVGNDPPGTGTETERSRGETKIIYKIAAENRVTVPASETVPEGFLPTVLTVEDTFGQTYEYTGFRLVCDDFDSKTAGEYFFRLEPLAPEDGFLFDEGLGVTVEVIPGEPVRITEEGPVGRAPWGGEPSLPRTLAGEDAFGNAVPVAVEWSCGDFDAGKSGEYRFTGRTEGGLAVPDCTVTVLSKEESPYRAPEGYYQPEFVTRSFSGGDYDVKPGVFGLKVYWVQLALGIDKHRGSFDSATEKALNTYLEILGLEQNCTVNEEVWRSFGYSSEDWKNLGTYVTPVRIDENTTREEMVQIMFETGAAYEGTTFVTGASGKPGQGVDCSGYVVQCLYSIGIYPDVANPIHHATCEYDSYNLWVDPKFPPIKEKDLRPGDLVFYHRIGDKNHEINHVAIYGGGTKVYESWPGKQYPKLNKKGLGYEIVGYKRVLAT